MQANDGDGVFFKGRRAAFSSFPESMSARGGTTCTSGSKRLDTALAIGFAYIGKFSNWR